MSRLVKIKIFPQPYITSFAGKEDTFSISILRHGRAKDIHRILKTG